MDAAAFRAGHPLASNLRLTLQTPEEVESAGDLGEFAAWAQDRLQLDYLNLSDSAK